MNTPPVNLPRARRTALTTQSLGTEILVFDQTNDSAHALNGPAAFVWQHADGTRTVQQIANEMTREFGAAADTQVVYYALDQLQQRQLLDTPVTIPAHVRGMTRRQFLTRAAAGAVLLAVVTSIVAPSPAHAQSGCIGEGGDCTGLGAICCDGFGCCVGLGPTCQDFC